EIVFDGRAKGQQLQPDAIAPGLAGARFSGISLSRMGGWPWWAAERAARIAGGKPCPALYHSPALSDPAPRNAPAIYTIHDLPPARFQDKGTVPQWAKAAMRAAWEIVTPSAWAKGELVELLDIPAEKVHVVPYG